MKHASHWMVVAAMVTMSLLAGCGGGGGGGGAAASPVVASTATFQLMLAFMNNFAGMVGNRPFSISGTLASTTSTATVSGTGVMTITAATPAFFEGFSGQLKTSTLTATATATDTAGTLTLSISVPGTTTYVDSSYRVVGYQVSGTPPVYAVFTPPASYPLTARVGDSGTAGTAVHYTDATKTTQTGSNTSTWALLADTANTALLQITQTYQPLAGAPSVQVDTYRITPAGSITLLSISVPVTVVTTAGTFSGTLTFTYS